MSVQSLSVQSLPSPTRVRGQSEWNDVLREHFVKLASSNLACADFTGTVRSAQMAQMRVATVQSIPQRISRDRNLIGADGSDYLQIGLMRRGSATVAQDGRSCVVDAGSYVLYDTGREFDWNFTGHPSDGTWTMDVLTWPRAALVLTEAEIQKLTAIALNGSVGVNALLGRFLRDVAATSLCGEDEGRVSATADGVAELVGTLLRSTLSPVAPHEDLYQSALAYLRGNLPDPALAPADIADALAISTRQLHRIFAHRGVSVSDTIRSARLERCRREILATTPLERSLDQICHAWGFSDLAVFSRAFKREYGVPPSKYRDRAASR